MTNHNTEPHIPARLEGDLRSAFGGFQGVPREVDAAVLAMAAGAAVGARRRRGRRLGVSVAATAAAAAVVVLVWVVGPGVVHKTGQSPQIAATTTGDLNGDGRVDMLDALIEAERGGNGVDVNGDGKVDGADVDALAMSAVKLERGSL